MNRCIWVVWVLCWWGWHQYWCCDGFTFGINCGDGVSVPAFHACISHWVFLSCVCVDMNKCNLALIGGTLCSVLVGCSLFLLWVCAIVPAIQETYNCATDHANHAHQQITPFRPQMYNYFSNHWYFSHSSICSTALG